MERIEHPAHRAIDEALEVAFDRGQALANKLSKLAEAREKSEIAARLEVGLGLGLGLGLRLELGLGLG